MQLKGITMTYDDFARDYIDATDCEFDCKCARCWRAWKYDDFPAEDEPQEPLIKLGPGGDFVQVWYPRDFS